MQCSTCDTTQATKLTRSGDERLPRGWKRLRDRVYCAKCWRERYVIRAITIPVVRPLGEGIGWPELREALREAWADTTACVNWMTTQLYTADELRNGQAKMPKMPRTYLYPEARRRFPRITPQSVTSIEQAVTAKYRKRRYETIWTCEASLPNARYPQPIVAHNQSWRPTYEPAGKDGGDMVPCVSVPINGNRWLLQLRGGRDYRRQLASFKLLERGDAIRGELQILRKRVGGNGADNRNGDAARDNGGQRFTTRVMIKMVGWFPRSTPCIRTGTLYLSTDRDCFLVALDERDEKLRIWNSDHVRRWIAEHSRQLQRWSDDQKAEQRPTAAFQSRRSAAVAKFHNRINSHIQETAAQIAGLAKRRRYATVRLSDTYRGYFGVGRYDWARFRNYLRQRLDQEGVTLEVASDELASESRGPLAQEEI